MSIKTRNQIIGNMKRLRRSVQIDLNTVDYWNAHVRRPHEEPVERDPGGHMQRLLNCLDEVISNDLGHGPIAPLNYQRSH